ncbi:MAG: hypothetical protein O6942_06515 [Bacteroidetes bacterium]|nr:hypothetical protein [Bacteroidota bacterium]
MTEVIDVVATDDSTTNNQELLDRVTIDGDMVSVHTEGVSQDFKIQELPDEFVRWQLDMKHSIYDSIEKNEYIAFNVGHLPVVGTWSADGHFLNLANKGIGFTPRNEYLEHYLNLVESAVSEIEKLPPHAVHETRSLRVNTAREIYSNPDHLDWRRLALLEIFEGTTFNNLKENPMASVLWTGNSPVFFSYQVDCVVEIITPEDLRYRFAWAMRRLFEYEPFHVVQTMYPYAYCFWVNGFKNKTPIRRYPGKRSDNTVNEGKGQIDHKA